ncbi:hypothetical protein Taro_026004 [Colocasia esculenta]|uniref:Uncharacterized protein n=1 Tax=Colocasia esculenta TaxID=4460 RepID=A0A843VBR4_COLES|nr:hypothetical protein [Colocasia esculenta]
MGGCRNKVVSRPDCSSRQGLGCRRVPQGRVALTTFW